MCCAEDVRYLRSLRFNWTKIAKTLQISRRTLYRRLHEWNLPNDIKYSEITDSELDSIVVNLKRENPACGEILLMSILHIRGFRIQRSRLRAAIHRTDQTLHCHQRSAIRRRIYSVEAPNSLWHIDGNHKLIKWKLVIHGGIDGKTRTIVYLHCSSNNTAATVLYHFQGAVSAYGLPDRVRSDRGGENIDVWRFMVNIHSSHSAVIAGSSVHNVRIERLWRDVYRCVASNYYELFYKLEEQNLFDPLNETDMYCLHWVFLPKINQHLHDFKESWNHHSLSSENNQTPYQMMLLSSRNFLLPNQLPVQTSLFPNIAVTNYVDIPRSNFNPCPMLLTKLSELNVNNSFDFGYHLYLQATNLVCNHLQFDVGCTCNVL